MRNTRQLFTEAAGMRVEMPATNSLSIKHLGRSCLKLHIQLFKVFNFIYHNSDFYSVHCSPNTSSLLPTLTFRLSQTHLCIPKGPLSLAFWAVFVHKTRYSNRFPAKKTQFWPQHGWAMRAMHSWLSLEAFSGIVESFSIWWVSKKILGIIPCAVELISDFNHI